MGNSAGTAWFHVVYMLVGLTDINAIPRDR